MIKLRVTVTKRAANNRAGVVARYLPDGSLDTSFGHHGTAITSNGVWGWSGLALTRDATIVLRFVGTREARRLNREFRGEDHATNVLTFDIYQTAFQFGRAGAASAMAVMLLVALLVVIGLFLRVNRED